MKKLLQSKNTCVLATCAANVPHCSLMAYTVNNDAGEILMATHTGTRKFRNISENSTVSLLIDAREKVPRSEAWALTVEGECTWARDGERAVHGRAVLLAAHPHLEAFLSHQDTVILTVRIASFLLLRGLTDATYCRIEL
jgi:nitroimidazol reductase NimA-like FMN-containing flavoprotein (pyridoxamine 5'-phosphate oxidase superfamily)